MEPTTLFFAVIAVAMVILGIVAIFNHQRQRDREEFARNWETANWTPVTTWSGNLSVGEQEPVIEVTQRIEDLSDEPIVKKPRKPRKPRKKVSADTLPSSSSSSNADQIGSTTVIDTAPSSVESSSE